MLSASGQSTLLGDIGATNARFALVANGVLGPVRNLEVAKFPRVADAVTHFLEGHPGQARVTRALLAIAGPVEGERCALTNCSWVIDAGEMRRTLSLEAKLVNDFEATASSLSALSPQDLFKVGGGRALADAPMAVLGPGSGLGVACLTQLGGSPVVISGEGGHVTLAGANNREDAILEHLRKRFGHASAERAISGPGLENIHQAIAAIDGKDIAVRNAGEITESAIRGESEPAREALEIFCALLGSLAGNVALTFGARGGVYIAGGIAPRMVDFIAQSKFRQRFEAKGRFQTYLETIPSHVIMHPAAAFIGLKSMAQRADFG